MRKNKKTIAGIIIALSLILLGGIVVDVVIDPPAKAFAIDPPA